MKAKKMSTVFWYLLLIFFAAVFILPVLMVFVGSIKTNEAQILSDLKGIRAFLPVGELGILNYQQIISRIDFFRFFTNSVIIVVLSLAVGTLVSSMIGYALARLEFPGKKILVAVIISMLIIPSESIMMTQLSLVFKMNLIDTITAQIFPAIADIFMIYLFYQGFMDIPHEIEEAAIVDGVSYPGIYARIVMPLSRPTIVTTLILTALGRWGDVLWPTMVTRGKSVRPLAIGVQQLFMDTSKNWGDIFASAVFMVLPILILYLIFQKQFVASMSTSGLK